MGENWSGPIEVRSALDGTVTNSGVARYQGLRCDHLVPVEQGAVDDDGAYVQVQTRQSHIFVAEAARTRVDDRPAAACPTVRNVFDQAGARGTGVVGSRSSRGQPSPSRRWSRSTPRGITPISEPGLAASAAVEDVERLRATCSRGHVLAWDQLWRRFDLPLTGQRRGRARILRLHVFHLLQTVSPNSHRPRLRRSRHEASTARRTAGTSSGTSCSSSRCSTCGSRS